MRWRGRRTSANIDDRRRGGGFGGGGVRLGGFGLVVVLLLGLFFGVDVTPLLTGGSVSSPAPSGPNQIDDEQEQLVALVLADTEEVWSEIFTASGLDYTTPTLVLFSGTTGSACGGASAGMGPFYCPVDQDIFLDTDFFRVMETELGAGGEFAQAYVIAHEVGHHVQNLLGVLGEVNEAKRGVNQTEANALSVRVELQADCYAGLWARQAEERFGLLEPGDIADALNTAARIGDDALQRASQGVVVPDSFTHGSSEQRQRWFRTGYDTGDPQACETFGNVPL